VTMKMKAQDVQNAPTERSVTLPGKRIAGIPLVDSVLCRKATELAQECYQPYLFSHAMRTYLFGALVGRSEKMDFDMELLYLACILHDIGLTSRFMGERPFEIEGAEAAQKFLERQGLSKVKSTIVWDGIAMHPLAIASFKQPEIALVSAGAGADVIGSDLDKIPESAKAAVVNAFPRLDFKHAFVKTCAGVVRQFPRGASRSFMRDIGERNVEQFHPTNICDLIEGAPFKE
jgi:hypothetical protein